MADNNILGTAFKLHTLGYSVIPSGAGPDRKAPAVEWKQYQTTPPDESQLDQWESELHPHLWGIVTNDHIAVIDADTPETRAALEAELGQPNVISPRGGAHWYLDTAGHPLKTVAGLLPGVDVRGVGGFINIAGSSVFGEYQILKLPIPDELIPWDKLPERIKAALNGNNLEHPHSQPITTKIFEGEGRNHAVAREAGRLCHIYKDPAIVKPMVWAYNQAVCVPPLSDEENARTWEKSLEKWASKENAPESPPLLARTPSCRGFPRSGG